MAADFSGVLVQLDASATHVTLSGKAHGPVAHPVTVDETITASDGSAETLHSTGTRTTTDALATGLTAVSDSLGGVWTIAADGQSASLN